MASNSFLAAALGDRIRQLRTARGWSQRDLARYAGVVNASMISYYELGDRMPSYSTLLRLADVFHVSTDYLLRGNEHRSLDVDGLPEDAVGALMTIIEQIHRK